MASRACFSNDLWQKNFFRSQDSIRNRKYLSKNKKMPSQHLKREMSTGYGKALAFQCLPIVADVIYGRPRGTSVFFLFFYLNIFDLTFAPEAT